MEGTVKWFKKDKGYGFIVGENGKEYFVHHSELPEGLELNENDKVNFTPRASDKGEQATKVELIEAD